MTSRKEGPLPGPAINGFDGFWWKLAGTIGIRAISVKPCESEERTSLNGLLILPTEPDNDSVNAIGI